MAVADQQQAFCFVDNSIGIRFEFLEFISFDDAKHSLVRIKKFPQIINAAVDVSLKYLAIHLERGFGIDVDGYNPLAQIKRHRRQRSPARLTRKTPGLKNTRGNLRHFGRNTKQPVRR